MCCRGLHRNANPAYLSRLLFSGLPCVAPYCAPGGIRVVSKGYGLRIAVPFVHLSTAYNDQIHVSNVPARSNQCFVVWRVGSCWSGPTHVTAINGTPRSRTLFSTPCSADWSMISPERRASPSKSSGAARAAPPF
jgi:hypothetical protein